MNEKKRTLDELMEAIEKCKKAQQERKKRQQDYCINKYYEKKKRNATRTQRTNLNTCISK